jgi:arylsulfatase A-like enzyme
MAVKREVDRREFLRSLALGVTSLTVGETACSARARPGSAGGASSLDAAAPDDRSDAATDAGGASSLDAAVPDDRSDAAVDASPPKRPNVLFILADQWRAQAAGFVGDDNARTPHLDRLAAKSVTFSHAVSCTPVCCPYRATLMTGRHPTTTGVFLNDVFLAADPESLGEVFKRAGYDTGYIGKWHLDGHGSRSAYIPRERRQGFVRWMALECTHDYNNSEYYTDDPIKQTWAGYDAIAQTRELQRWLAERDPATPFFYFLSWGPPHDPYETAPAESQTLFNPESIVLRPNVPASLHNTVRANLAGYYAHIATLDNCINDLLQTLDELGLADDTILVFTSDHGDMHGSQNQFAKEQPWDESILVPFLIRYPAVLGKTQRTIPMPLNTPDILPTLLGLAGLAIPQTVEGSDLSPVLRSEKAPEENAALIMCVSPFGVWSRQAGGKEYRGLRGDRFTYVRDLAGPWLLYDNDADPYQLNNLVNQADFAKVQADLETQLASKLGAIDDSFHPGDWYVSQWGYTVGSDGAVPFSG